jgi:acetolactate synthase-1/2/3 large subunit
VDLPILGDARVFLRELIERLRERRDRMDLAGRRKAVAELTAMRDAHRRSLDKVLEDREVPMVTAHVGAVCRELFDDDAVMVFDGGNTAVWGNFYSQVRVANTQLGTHHFGHLGAGAGQALRCCGRAPTQPGLLHHGRRRHGLSSAGDRDRDPQRPARDLPRLLRPAVGNGQADRELGLDPVKTVAKKLLGQEGKAMELPWKVPAQLEKATSKLLGPLRTRSPARCRAHRQR